MGVVEVLGPALAAGAVAVGTAVAVERLGGETGGLIGTVPTTMVPFAIGLAARTPRDDVALQDALLAAPAAMLLNAVFLWSWRALPPRLPAVSPRSRLALMVAITVGGWALAATALVLGLGALRARGLPIAPAGVAAFVLIVAIGVRACIGRPHAPRGSNPVGPITLLARGILAATAIGVAVAVSRTAGPLVAGAAAVFPAIFLTTMVSLWLAQGETVQTGAVGPMLLGSASVPAFSLLGALLLPALGPWLGAAAAWILAVLLVTLPARALLRRVSARASG